MKISFPRCVLIPALLAALLSGCGGSSTKPQDAQRDDTNAPENNVVSPDGQLASIIADNGIFPLRPPPRATDAQLSLGQALFFDKELSGNRDVSCATCHHPLLHTSDNLSVSLGTGGTGLGPSRIKGPVRNLIPRNSPELFNRGLHTVTTLFWDGRVAGTRISGFDTPAGSALLPGVNSAFAAQAFFPPTSNDEMRGNAGDRDVFGGVNEIALLAEDDLQGIWTAVMTRLLALPAYVQMFQAAYPTIPISQLDYSHAANAIAAFETARWTAIDTPWDRYVAGDTSALSTTAKQGAILFFGKARCSECHSSPLFTDQGFHNIAVPQVGPGKGSSAPLDFGFELVTGNPDDRFKFKTPPLRNVVLTAPYMHNGAYVSLRDAVAHHFNAQQALLSYDPSQLSAELQTAVHNDFQTQQALLQTLDQKSATPLLLSGAELNQLMEFLNALTDPASLDLSGDIPASVPSGLPVAD
jgi:cytochrome c peroxidase